MRRRLGILAGWSLATTIAILLAGEAVGLVQAQVTERPPVLRPTATSPSLPTSTLLAEAALDSVPPEQTTPFGDGQEERPPQDPEGSSRTEDGTVSTPSSDAAGTEAGTASSTTTGTDAPLGEITGPWFINSHGGLVSATCLGDSISFVTALQTSGFAFQMGSEGPDMVVVDFLQIHGSHSSHIEAHCEAGEVFKNVVEN